MLVLFIDEDLSYFKGKKGMWSLVVQAPHSFQVIGFVVRWLEFHQLLLKTRLTNLNFHEVSAFAKV